MTWVVKYDSHYVNEEGFVTWCQHLARKHKTLEAARAHAGRVVNGRGHVVRLLPGEKARLREALRVAVEVLDTVAEREDAHNDTIGEIKVYRENGTKVWLQEAAVEALAICRAALEGPAEGKEAGE